MQDAVEELLKLVGASSHEKFIADGIASIHFPSVQNVAQDFDRLVQEIGDKNCSIYIRAYGRGNKSGKRDEFNAFITALLGRVALEDPTNNTNPQSRFWKNSGFSKTQFNNYKLSHVWDKTSKNPFAFCALWNMCLTPFYLDPFTGHEIKGQLSKDFSTALKREVISRYQPTIEQYNRLMKEVIAPKLDVHINELKQNGQFKISELDKIKDNFCEIPLCL